jgi:hypothetical protein
MADELVLYTNPMSRGRVARWMLEEVGQPYRAEVLEYARSMKAPEYLAVNPMGKAPRCATATPLSECASGRSTRARDRRQAHCRAAKGWMTNRTDRGETCD